MRTRGGVMTGAEFMRRVKTLGRKNSIAVRWDETHGKGSHGRLYYGERFPQRICEMAPMRDLVYCAKLVPQKGGGFLVRFPDVPEALAEGGDRADALQAAEDALITALGGYLEAKRPLPMAKRRKGLEPIRVPPLEAAKIALHEAMRTEGMSGRELARRLGVQEGAVRRLLNLSHRSHIGEVERALAIFGLRLSLRIERAAA
jgi:antitoxin HicB